MIQFGLIWFIMLNYVGCILLWLFCNAPFIFLAGLALWPNATYAIGRCHWWCHCPCSLPSHMVETSNFLCVICMDIQLPCMYMKYFAYMAYICNLVATFFLAHVTITCEVEWYSRLCFDMYVPVLGLYVHAVWGQCALHVQCGSHIC